jgi:hypothetical protein
LLPVALGVTALVIIGVVIALVAGGGGDDGTGDGTTIGQGAVLLEPINTPVPNPFAPGGTATTGTEPTVQTNALPAGVPARAGSGGQVNGSAPGLYGGSGNAGVCNRDQLVAFLEANPGKARAWAAVLGITTAQIRDYVASLTPVVLTTDTLVLNHGYVNGKATPRNAVLQAGTAVLVDKFGIPRVKCGCGNPLLPPTITKATKIRGPRWPGFQPTNVTQVVTGNTINIFVIVDVNTGELINRPVGTDGSQDTPVLVDQQCDLFPNDPACTTTTTSSTTLAPAPTASPTSPPTAPPTTPEVIPVNTPEDAIGAVLGGAGHTYIGARCAPYSARTTAPTASTSTGRSVRWVPPGHSISPSRVITGSSSTDARPSRVIGSRRGYRWYRPTSRALPSTCPLIAARRSDAVAFPGMTVGASSSAKSVMR